MMYPESSRQRILVSVDWFPPAFRAGGPIRSAFNLVALLSKSYDVWVISGAYDLGDDHPLDIPLDSWQIVKCGDETIQVMHWTKPNWNSRSWSQLLKELNPDWLHLNSVFSKHFTLLPLRVARKFSNLRIALAPRGMLGSAALGFKPLKKRVFLAFARATGIFRDIRWHASTSQERDEVLGQFMGAECRVAQNIPGRSSTEVAPRNPERWNVVSVGRIHRVKNLHFGLSALLNTSSSRPVKMTFIGPVEDAAYQKELVAMAQGQDRVVVEFIGGMSSEALEPFWQKAHYLLSSTNQENYGHSIVEAWSHGCPVLISDRTPWHKLEGKGIGWDWPLDQKVWLNGLKTALNLPHPEWEQQSKNSHMFFNTEVRNAEVEQDNLNLFQP
jgi:glycosyltransferase involved in cell wall biosynthesis